MFWWACCSPTCLFIYISHWENCLYIFVGFFSGKEMIILRWTSKKSVKHFSVFLYILICMMIYGVGSEKKYDKLKVGPTHLVLFNAYLYQISRKCLDFLNYSCSRIFICIRLWSIHLFIVFDFWEKLISHDRLIGAPTHSAKNDFRFQLWTKLEGNWQRNYIDIFSIWPLGNFKVRIVLLLLQ